MRLRKDAKVDAIGRVPLFEGLSKKQLGQLATIADEMDFREGKVLIREGLPGREFFVLVDGSVEVRRKGRKVKTLGKGDFFGEMALVSDSPRNATVTATSQVRALVITDRSFKRLLRETPSISLTVLATVAERASELAKLGV